MESVSMVMITTPATGKTFLIDSSDVTDENGNPFMMVYKVPLICRRCLRIGTAESCKHQLRKYFPKWKSMERHDMVRKILKDDIDVLLRESYGLEAKSHKSQFKKEKLELMFSRTPWIPDVADPPRHVVVAVDPNASDNARCSEMALVAVAMHRGLFYVVGLASHACGPGTESRDMLRTFMIALHAHKYLEKAKLVFCPENNMRGNEILLAECLYDLPYCILISQKGSNVDLGYRTDRRFKYQCLWSSESAVNYEQVSFLRDWVNINPLTPRSREMERRRVFDELMEQLRRYDEHELNDSRTVVSGRVENGKISAVLNDDLAVAFCMAIHVNVLIANERVPGFNYGILA